MKRKIKSLSTEQEKSYQLKMEEHIQNILKGKKATEVLNDFAKYASRQQITRFLAYNEIFQLARDVQGSIVECGVYSGQGLMTWAQLSSIYEPVSGMQREIFGFDTFAGFPKINKKDITGVSSRLKHQKGDLLLDSYQDLQKCIELYNMNRFLNQFPKVKLIKGDFLKTADKFLKDHPHTLISILYLDFDIYEPTKKALEVFIPRMPKGSILAFDEINNSTWPGETLALLETLGVSNLNIKKIEYDIKISYAVL